MLRGEVHINALGAILPTHAELEPELVETAELLVVDNTINVQAGSRELREACDASRSWDEVDDIGLARALVTGGAPALIELAKACPTSPAT